MKYHLCMVLKIVYLWSFTCAIAVSASPSPREQVKCLELKGFGFASDTALLYVSALGFRSGGRNGWVLWNHKHAKSLLVLNPDNKTFLVDPLEKDWTTNEKRWAKWQDFPPPKKVGAAIICGLPCTEYTISTSESPAKVWFEFWSCTQVPCNDAALKAWAQASGIPPGYGLPIRVRRLIHDNMITTTNVTAANSLTKPAEFFELDASYHQAADRAALMFSKNGSLNPHDLDDLFMLPPKSTGTKKP